MTAGLNRYQRLSYRLLGRAVRRAAESNAHLRITLQKAHIPLRPDVYLAYSFLNAILAFLGSLVFVFGLVLLHLQGVLTVPPLLLVVVVPFPLVLATTLYLLTFLLPDLRASSRGRDIDTRLPYALNYIATMGSAGVPPQKIFAGLAEQRVYGEVSNEMAWITRDLRVLGMDLMTALAKAIDRSPSVRFQDLLQGALTALSSGESLKDYFLSKSQQYFHENRQNQKRFVETLGVMAESYVTIIVAAPLFLIVILSVMLMFGASGESVLLIGYLLVLVFLPFAQFMFGASLKFMTPEV